MNKLIKHTKIVNGEKIGEFYSGTIMVNKDGMVNILDNSQVDWHEFVDCSTLHVQQLEVQVNMD